MQQHVCCIRAGIFKIRAAQPTACLPCGFPQRSTPAGHQFVYATICRKQATRKLEHLSEPFKHYNCFLNFMCSATPLKYIADRFFKYLKNYFCF